MNREGQGIEPVQQRGSRSVQEFIANAEDAAVAGGGCVLPAAPGDDFLERDTIAGAAPCGEDDFRIEPRDFFLVDVAPGMAEEFSARGLDQLGDPWLRSDQGPLFTVNARARTCSMRSIISAMIFSPRSRAPTKPEIAAMSV
jgi:hypothetical protein